MDINSETLLLRLRQNMLETPGAGASQQNSPVNGSVFARILEQDRGKDSASPQAEATGQRGGAPSVESRGHAESLMIIDRSIVTEGELAARLQRLNSIQVPEALTSAQVTEFLTDYVLKGS